MEGVKFKKTREKNDVKDRNSQLGSICTVTNYKFRYFLCNKIIGRGNSKYKKKELNEIIYKLIGKKIVYNILE